MALKIICLDCVAEVKQIETMPADHSGAIIWVECHGRRLAINVGDALWTKASKEDVRVSLTSLEVHGYPGMAYKDALAHGIKNMQRFDFWARFYTNHVDASSTSYEAEIGQLLKKNAELIERVSTLLIQLVGATEKKERALKGL